MRAPRGAPVRRGAAPGAARARRAGLRRRGFPPHRKETTWPTVRKTSSSCSSVALYGMLPTNTDRAELERDDMLAEPPLWREFVGKSKWLGLRGTHRASAAALSTSPAG